MAEVTLRVVAKVEDNNPLCCASMCPHKSFGFCALSKESLQETSDGSLLRSDLCKDLQTKPEVIDTMTLVNSQDLAYRVAFGAICDAAPNDVTTHFSIEPGDNNIRLEFYLNGVKADILPFFKQVEERFDWHVQQEAVRQIREKFANLSDLISRVETTILQEFPNEDA